MSDKTISRRTEVEVAVEGADISDSIRRYLKSLTYTDNEEDEADDLQIVLQDRDGIWMEKWLNDMIEAAASSPEGDGGSGAGGEDVYTVVKGDTLSGIAKKYGTTWQELARYNGIQNPNLIFPKQKIRIPGGASEAESGQEGKNVSTGLSIEANIVRRNWNTDGKDLLLPCGKFELDTLDCDGPPAEVTIRATALPFQSKIRQEKKNRGWEKYKLSGIAAEMSGRSGMVCMFLSANDPFYERVEQYQMSDIAFLKRLCHDAGISLKASGKMLVLFDQPDYEAKPEVLTIRKGNGRLRSGEKAYGAYGRDESYEAYTEYHLSMGTADVQYQSCRVSYNDPATGKCIEGVARIPDYKSSDKNQQLEIKAKVASAAQAKRLAEKRLRLHNKYCRTAEFTMPGNPKLAAGVTVMLLGWGSWDGKYIVKRATHTVGEDGYTTAVLLRRALEGY